jgi:hypothetical protein
VWNPSGDSSYTPVGRYVDYKTLSGETTSISAEKISAENKSAGKPVRVGVKPIMLEVAN